MFMDDLTINAGNLDLYLSGEPGLSIRGNITIKSGTRLNLLSGTMLLNGLHHKPLRGSGHLGQGVGLSWS